MEGTPRRVGVLPFGFKPKGHNVRPTWDLPQGSLESRIPCGPSVPMFTSLPVLGPGFTNS